MNDLALVLLFIVCKFFVSLMAGTGAVETWSRYFENCCK